MFAEKYDERALQIRGRAALVGMLLMACLILIKNFAEDIFNITFQSNTRADFLVIMISFIYVVSALVYKQCMSRRGARMLAYMFAALGAVMLVLNVVHIAMDGDIFYQGVVSNNLIGVLLAIVYLVPIVAYAASSKASKED